MHFKWQNFFIVDSYTGSTADHKRIDLWPQNPSWPKIWGSKGTPMYFKWDNFLLMILIQD